MLRLFYGVVGLILRWRGIWMLCGMMMMMKVMMKVMMVMVGDGDGDRMSLS